MYTYIYLYIYIYIHIYISIHMYSRLQIGWHRILRIFLKTFNLVLGIPGFSSYLSFAQHYYAVLIVKPMGRILVRWKSLRNNLKIMCHPICNQLEMYIDIFISIYIYIYIHVYVYICINIYTYVHT